MARKEKRKDDEARQKAAEVFDALHILNRAGLNIFTHVMGAQEMTPMKAYYDLMNVWIEEQEDKWQDLRKATKALKRVLNPDFRINAPMQVY